MLDFWHVLGATRRQARTVVLGLAAGVAAALAVTLSATPTYRATATLFVGGSVRGANPLVGLQQAYVAPTVVPAYAELARTRSVALAAARKAGVNPSEVTGRVVTDLQPGVQILKLGAEASSAAKAARIANALAATLSQRIDELGSVESGALRVRVVDPAQPPAKPVSPRLAFSLLLGSLTGLLAGVGLALACDRAARPRRAPASSKPPRPTRTRRPKNDVRVLARR